MKLALYHILIFLLFTVLVIIINSCANIAMPSGGPKDVTPPREVKSDPPNHSKNFNSKKIRIYFDEFVTLKDVASQVIISPPMETMPEFNLRGKSVMINFDADFEENTTYTIFLGSAIADITENNIMSNYEYVFSTGKTIDSLSIRGKVVNAFNNQPEKDILVMLYKQTYDSIPYKEKPYYLTRTDESGVFALNNLSEGNYKVFALRDANSNYLYDLPNEAIAFADSLVEPQYYEILKPDTTVNDSLHDTALINDTIQDFLHELFLFEETDYQQKLIRAYSPKKGKFVLIFQRPTDQPRIRVLNHDFNNIWYIEDFNKTKDTLNYWVINNEKDTLLIEITDNQTVFDTSEIVIAAKAKPSKKKQKDEEAHEAGTLTFTSNAKRAFDYYDNLKLTSSYPIEKSDFSEILFIESEDTLKAPLSFVDDIKMNIILDYELKENTTYKLIIPDSVFTDIMGFCNDSIIIDFNTSSQDDYGTLILKLQTPSGDYKFLIQLLTEKEQLINQQSITSDTIIVYKYLKPAKYILKAFKDKNNNDKWDTGDYLNKIQPEKVYYFPARINIRAKWEIEEEWKL